MSSTLQSLSSKLVLVLAAGVALALAPIPLKTQQPAHPHPSVGQASAVEEARLRETYGNLPLSFESNRGQFGEDAKFVSRGAAGDTLLTCTGALFALKGSGPALRNQFRRDSHFDAASKSTSSLLEMKLLGGNDLAPAAGVEELPGKSHYLIGRDASKWHTNVPTFRKVKYSGVYPGIDVVYYGNQRQLEYDFVVAPGADPRTIQLGFRGMDSLRIDPSGDLVVQVDGKALIQKRPFAHQMVDGQKQEVPSRYVLLESDRVALRLGAYDATRTLVIDPLLVYSTYLGGSGADQALAVAVDRLGNAYLTGYTSSTDFPTTANAFDRVPPGGYDVFVTKINAAGSAIIYSTYLGGSGDEFAYGIALDAQGNAYVVGDTTSTDFPTANPFQANLGGNVDAFVTKLNPSGSALVYSTYLGGNGTDDGLAIAVDAQGSAYVTGDTISPNFPLKNPIQAVLAGGYDAYLAKLTPSGSALVYSTYLGGLRDDYAYGLAVDGSGNAYLAGLTGSTNFPTLNPLQASAGGRFDAFVAKVNPSGSALVYSTYLGGAADDWANGIAVDAAGSVYLTGQTNSTNFPTHNPIQASFGGSTDAFVAKLNSSGSALVYSTYLGGRGSDIGMSVAVDGVGNAYLAGYTNSTDFPVLAAIQSSLGGGYDAFVTKLNASGSALVFSTLLGGNNDEQAGSIGVDGSGNAYVVGATSSANLPLANALQPIYRGASDAFIARIGSGGVGVISISPTSEPSSGAVPITITGSNFVPGATVTLGGVLATQVTVQSTTTLVAVSPAHASGVVDVTVTNPDQQSGTLHAGHTYLSSVSVTGIAPATGSISGGTAITVTGANFVSGATVKMDGVAASSVSVISATSLVATTPAHSTGVVDVVVTNPNTDQGTLLGGFTYLAPPSLTAIDVASGPPAGGTAVTLTGANFASGATVTFDGTPATSVVLVSGTSIAAITPAHAAGVVNVAVINSDGQQATLTSGYDYSSGSAGPAHGCGAAAGTQGTSTLALLVGIMLLVSRRARRCRNP